MFDLFKNKELDRTPTCPMFDFKTVFETGQTRGQETGQKPKIMSLIKPRDNFLSSSQVV
jgi:hypothetical protein